MMGTKRLYSALVAGFLLVFLCAAAPAWAVEIRGEVTNTTDGGVGVDGIQVMLEQMGPQGSQFFQDETKMVLMPDPLDPQGPPIELHGQYSFGEMPEGPDIFYVVTLVNLPLVAPDLEASVVIVDDPSNPTSPVTVAIDPPTQMPSSGPIASEPHETGDPTGGASFPVYRQGGEDDLSNGDFFGLVFLDVGTCDGKFQQAIDDVFDPARTQPLLDDTQVRLKFLVPANGGEVVVPVTAASRPSPLASLRNFVFKELLVGLDGLVTVELSLERAGVPVGETTTQRLLVIPAGDRPASYEFIPPKLLVDCRKGLVFGTVFDDTNGNGAYDPGVDTPRADMRVRFVDPSGAALGSALTAGDGAYTFEVPEYGLVEATVEGTGLTPAPSLVRLVPGTAVRGDFPLPAEPLPTPPVISYASPQTYVVGEAIAPLAPSSTGGPVDNYRLLLPLPAGLRLNATTGVISGTPTAAQAATGASVQATNAGGTDEAGIRISVELEAEPECEKESCDWGNLHEVLLTTQVWVGYDPSSIALTAKLYESRRRRSDYVDVVSLGYRGTSFPGPVTGLDEVLTLEGVSVQDGWANVRLRVTANPRSLRGGSFGRVRRRLEVSVNGRDVLAAPRLRCEKVRPGGAIRACGGTFGVRSTWSHASWQRCEGDVILPPPPRPPCVVPPTACRPCVPPPVACSPCVPPPTPKASSRSYKSKKSAKSAKSAKSKKSSKAKAKKAKRKGGKGKKRGRRRR